MYADVRSFCGDIHFEEPVKAWTNYKPLLKRVQNVGVKLTAVQSAKNCVGRCIIRLSARMVTHLYSGSHLPDCLQTNYDSQVWTQLFKYIIWKTLEVLSETIFLEAAGYFPRYTAHMHSSEMTSFFKGMSNIEDCISTALTSQVWDCDKGSVFQNLYDIGLGPADCTCTNKLRYPAWAVPCSTAAEGSMRVGMRCRIRDTWAILPSATELANRLGAVKAGWVPEPPDETCTSGCTNGDEGVVIGRGLIHRGGHNAYGHNEFETAVAVQMASRCVRTSGGVSSAAKKPVVVLIDERSVQYIGRQLTGSVDLDSSECAICLEEHCRDTVVLDCTHSFCYVCLERHQSQTAGAVCPLCRDSMRDIAKDGVPEGVRWRAGDRVHARFPRESTVDGTDVAVIDPKSGIPFEVLATVTGLPEGSFEPSVLFITYV